MFVLQIVQKKRQKYEKKHLKIKKLAMMWLFEELLYFCDLKIVAHVAQYRYCVLFLRHY